MRKIFYIFTLLLSLSLTAQVEKIKVKKEEAPSKKPVVTLAGLQTGEVSLTKLCSDKKFRIANNPDGYKVDFGILKFTDDQKQLTEWVNSTDSLNTNFVFYLLSERSSPKTKVTIYNIKAKNKEGKEIKLNDIVLTIIKGSSNQ